MAAQQFVKILSTNSTKLRSIQLELTNTFSLALGIQKTL